VGNKKPTVIIKNRRREWGGTKGVFGKGKLLKKKKEGSLWKSRKGPVKKHLAIKTPTRGSQKRKTKKKRVADSYEPPGAEEIQKQSEMT